MLSLSVKTRKAEENVDALRKSGFIPAVFYGKKTESTPISISLVDFKKAYKQAGESGVVTLKGDIGEEVDTLINDIDFDPVTGVPRHADFYVFDKMKKMEVDVPVEFVGEAPAIKAGLLVVKVMHDIKVEALPTAIPHSIEVDISKLEKDGDVVSVKDLSVPAGVSIVDNPEDTVASVQTPKEEKEEVPVDLSAIEVEKKGKEAKEGEETMPPEGEPKAE